MTAEITEYIGDGNEEATTSKADCNEPNHTAHNTNESETLKPLYFNSADDVRQAMTSILTDELSKTNETIDNPATKCYVDAETNVTSDLHEQTTLTESCSIHKGSKIGVNRTQAFVTKKQEDKKIEKQEGLRQNRKRPKAPKAKPAKRYKRAKVQGFYWGKLSNLVFLKRCHRSDSSSDESIFSL